MARRSRPNKGAPQNAAQPGHPAVLATLIGMFVVGAMVIPPISDQLGMVAYDLETGRGRVAVSSCDRSWPWRECTGTLTEWTGEKHSVGDRVVVTGRTAMSGTVDVVGRVHGESTIDKYRNTIVSTKDFLLPADVWVMPNYARIPVLLGLGIAWLALMWGARQWVRRLTARKGSSADGRGR